MRKPTGTVVTTMARVARTGPGKKVTLARKKRRANVQLPSPLSTLTPIPSGKAAAVADLEVGATVADVGPLSAAPAAAAITPQSRILEAPRKINAAERTETAAGDEMTAAAEALMVPVETSTTDGAVVVVVAITDVGERIVRVSVPPAPAQPTVAGARAPAPDGNRASADVTIVQVKALILTMRKTAAAVLAVENIGIDDGRAVEAKATAVVTEIILTAVVIAARAARKNL